MGIIYYIYLLFIIIFLLNLLKNSDKISGIKVKVYIKISLLIFFIRYITLMFFRICNSTRYLYMLKLTIFINALGIIMLTIMFIYVFLKKNNINFKYNYCLALSFTGAYFTLIKFVNVKIIYNVNFGYVISEISNYFKVSFAYLFSISLLLIISILFLDKKNAETKNIVVLVLILAFIIFENILFMCGIRILPYVMISDLPCLIFLKYVIKKLPKSN